MKEVVLPKGYHYTGTTVEFTRSIEQIKQMPMKHGCSKIGEMRTINNDGVPHLVLVFENIGTPCTIEFPTTYISTKSGKKELNMNISGRIIHDRVKALLVEVDIGYLDFAQAMMPYLLVDTPRGRIALEDAVKENEDKFKHGTFAMNLLTDGGL